MSIFCILVAILTTIFVLMLGQYNDTVLNISIMYTNFQGQVSLLVLSLIIFSLGILCGIMLMLSSFFDTKSRYANLRRQYDKTSITADDADERIKLLENKIQTLEAALKKQMEN